MPKKELSARQTFFQGKNIYQNEHFGRMKILSKKVTQCRENRMFFPQPLNELIMKKPKVVGPLCSQNFVSTKNQEVSIRKIQKKKSHKSEKTKGGSEKSKKNLWSPLRVYFCRR